LALCEKSKLFELLRISTTTSDTFKNTPPAISKFSRTLFRRIGASFCKFLQVLARFRFFFVFFVFVFLGLFLNFFINLFYFGTLREKQQLFETLRMSTATSDTFKNDKKQRSKDNS
jgi:hypothetical protein